MFDIKSAFRVGKMNADTPDVRWEELKDVKYSKI